MRLLPKFTSSGDFGDELPQDSNSADSVLDDDVSSGEQGASAGLFVVVATLTRKEVPSACDPKPEHENRRLVHDRPEDPPSSVVVDIAMDAIAGFFFFLLMPALAVGGFSSKFFL